ncbi:hypothetical protein [uncultured Megasphaera sp.]|uniref:hypothetical protein n=1 Tax=uncultured Megasphaera sp. TaxID=165188 RepID=UPI00259922D9|nr:hypothetical protein [uncultured Megasphaera sp.]
MQALKLDLENCYGIKKMNETIDYSNNNVAIIYAPNGTMKSSLAKTFEAIRDDRQVEEKIYGFKSSCSISDEDNVAISKEQIIVINPFDENAYEGQGLLMANEPLRKAYLNIHDSIEFKKELLYSKIKEKFGYSNRNNFDVKNTMLNDWGLTVKKEYDCLIKIKELLHDPMMNCQLNEDDIDYASLFNDKVYSMMKTGKTGELIEEYENKYRELVDKSLYMQQGIIDHNNYGNISNALNANGFFVANNEVVLKAKDGSTSITLKEKKELDDLIKKEKEQVLNSKEIKELFEKINKAISKNKDTQAFNAFLQTHQDIIVEYKDIDLFKKKVWVKVFLYYERLLDELIDDYNKAQEDLKKLRDDAREQVTDWKKALDLFKERFFVPFSIEPSNQEDVILNMELPSFKYIFSDSRGEKEVTKDNLLNVLSTGERRAYYILNMIFQILVAKKQGKECLVVLDDISESFDYKNKYAIIEYISDISEYTDANDEKLFKILLLTHNFDFYRTVSSRITKRGNSFIAFVDSDKIKLEKGQYTKNIFMHYKNTLVKKYSDNIMVASIPFVRNLIEYTEGDDNEDYLTLTSVLHYKENTREITLNQIQDIFNKYWCKKETTKFAVGRESKLVYDILMQESEKITDIEKLEIENKLILSMAIRLMGEEYMQNKIISGLSNGQDILKDIFSKKNQSAWLIKEYKKHINDDAMNTLEIVAMITPENIHLNSFMFEPILDMSLKHLYKIYNDVKALS